MATAVSAPPRSPWVSLAGSVVLEPVQPTWGACTVRTSYSSHGYHLPSHPTIHFDLRSVTDRLGNPKPQLSCLKTGRSVRHNLLCGAPLPSG